MRFERRCKRCGGRITAILGTVEFDGVTDDDQRMSRAVCTGVTSRIEHFRCGDCGDDSENQHNHDQFDQSEPVSFHLVSISRIHLNPTLI